MRFCIVFLLSLGFSITGFSQHQNVLISDSNSPEEPTIIINPKNTMQLLAGANLNNYYYSNDGGVSWIVGQMNSQYVVWGDPCVIVDTLGDFYFFHLSYPNYTDFIDRIVCQKSVDGGASWQDSGYMGFVEGKAQDKEWACVDRSNNNIYVSWTQFDDYGSYNSADSSMIKFSKSVDGGLTWSPAIRINEEGGDCIDSDNTVEGAVPTVGTQGEIFVSWASGSGLIFDRSIDQGETWLDEDILVTDIPGGWDYHVSGISRCNGLPVTICDTSGGDYHGTIYINWTDQRNGSEDTDVWLIKSVDGGDSWSDIKRVNDDPPGKHQFFTWMTIDQTTGYLWFVYYDRRNYESELTDVYGAVSYDGGESFVNFKISESSFDPNQGVFFGDYTNITAHDNIIRPIWTRLDNTDLSIWTALIDVESLGVEYQEVNETDLYQNYPNPFDSNTYIKFKLYMGSKICLKILDICGKEVATLIDMEYYNIGKHVYGFNAIEYNMNSGVYFYSLQTNNNEYVKMMILE